MKENLKTVGVYIAKLAKVVIVALLLWAKVVADTLFEITLAVFYAVFNDRENCGKTMESVFKKLD